MRPILCTGSPQSLSSLQNGQRLLQLCSKASTLNLDHNLAALSLLVLYYRQKGCRNFHKAHCRPIKQNEFDLISEVFSSCNTAQTYK